MIVFIDGTQLGMGEANLSLDEIDDIIELAINDLGIDIPLPFSELKPLILFCTKDVQFSFSKQLFIQHDGVAMGSPLGHVLANIFLGYVKRYVLADSLRKTTYRPIKFFRYVDDTFAIFNALADADQFLADLNNHSLTHSNRMAIK